MRQTIFIAVLFFIGTTVFGQHNHGYIDYEKVVQTLPEYEKGEIELKLKSKVLQDSLDRMRIEFQNFLEHGIPHNIKPDSTVIVAINDNLQTMQKRIEDYSKHAEDEMMKAENTLKLKLEGIISENLTKFCKYNGITVLALKEEILYCVDCTDYTDKFINYLKNKK